MKKYDIEVEEILRRAIRIDANNIDEAIDKVGEQYNNGEIVLDSSDHCETSFSNLYSKSLDEPINISISYNPKNEILTIVQDNNKECRYACDTVENIKSCLRLYIADYIENSEIEADKELE